MSDERFWETKSLAEMNAEEWESLCDGCAKCCLVKFEDADTGEISHTTVSCRLLDGESCRCVNYENRHAIVPGCGVLTPETVARFDWLPETCAYRRIAKGEPLPSWHHLITGDRESIHRAGLSMRGKTISELEAFGEDWEDEDD